MQLSMILQSLQYLLKPKRLAILEAVLIGLIAAIAAVFLKQAVIFLGEWRLHEASLLPAWLLLPLIGAAGGFLAGLVVEQWAPEAAGSGVPQVKAALAHVPIALNLRVALGKLISTTLTLSSGFTLGRQGPTVQIGAALAAQLSRWMPASPDHQRQLIAAGAAAGLAAGFDAPIAGVMFVIEELLQDVSSLTLGTAILASFTGGVISRLLSGPSWRVGFNPLAHDSHFTLVEIPWFLLLGLLAGVFASLFNRGILTGLRFSRRHVHLSLPLKVALAGLISGITTAMLPIVFRDTSQLQVFLTGGTASWQLTAVAFVTQFTLTLVACSMETPGGLFTPSLILGAALGHLVGTLEQTLLGGEPVIYALTGMGAFFGAVAKVPVTAIVIVFEITTSFELVLPLMIAAVTAYLVSELLAPGSLYTHLLELKGIHLEPEKASDGLWSRLTAADVMQKNVETLTSQMSLGEAVEAFSRSHHRGFPVLENGKLVGIITLTDLDKVAQRQLTGDALVKDIMTSRPVGVNPSDPLTQVLYLLSRYKLSRLPVTEGRRLVGIITRSDILQVESDKLRGGTDRVGPKPEPSYVVYQTRSPAIGQGRLLLPISNPQTAPHLLAMAMAIAQEHQYEIECLQVLLVPRHTPPAESAVNTTRSRRLLTQLVQQAKAANLPIHTQIRAAHTVDQAILETIKDRHIDLLLMGWKGSTSTPGRIFGDVVDTMIRQSPSDVVLVKWGNDEAARNAGGEHPLNRWLVPIAGGPNSQHAITLLPALVSLSQQPEVRLCQVFHPSDGQQNLSVLKQDASFLQQRLQRPVITQTVSANSVAEAVLHMAQHDQCDVVMLGASREGLLQQAIHGNLPEVIAGHCQCTVILVRKAIASSLND